MSRIFLGRSQCSGKLRLDVPFDKPLIENRICRSRLLEKGEEIFLAATWQGDATVALLGQVDDTRFSPNRLVHGLRSIKLRIGECCKATDAVACRGRKTFQGDIDHIGFGEHGKGRKVLRCEGALGPTYG